MLHNPQAIFSILIFKLDIHQEMTLLLTQANWLNWVLQTRKMKCRKAAEQHHNTLPTISIQCDMLIKQNPPHHEIDYYYVRLESRGSDILDSFLDAGKQLRFSECVNLFLNVFPISWMQLSCLTLRTLVNTWEVSKDTNTSLKTKMLYLVIYTLAP